MGAEHLPLLQQGIDQGGFAMVYVGDYREVANIAVDFVTSQFFQNRLEKPSFRGPVGPDQ